LSSRPTQQWSGRPLVVWNGHCDFTEGKPVTTICLASSTIGKAICRCPGCRGRPVAPSYASDSWSQITGSRARTQGPLQYASTASVGLVRETHPPLAWAWPCIVQPHPKGRGLSTALKVVTLPHACRMAKKPKPPKPISRVHGSVTSVEITAVISPARRVIAVSPSASWPAP
jgi:hypothetical protein